MSDYQHKVIFAYADAAQKVAICAALDEHKIIYVDTPHMQQVIIPIGNIGKHKQFLETIKKLQK
jgi:hypothetical protein